MKYEVFLWIGVLSLLFSYIAWTKMRVAIIRMQLFNIRDRLWLDMYYLENLDDLGHRECADVICGMIRVAPWLNLAEYLYLASEADDNITASHMATRDSAPEPVKAAVNQLVYEVSTYMLHGGIMGWSAMLLSELFGLRLLIEKITSKCTSRIAFNPGKEKLAELQTC